MAVLSAAMQSKIAQMKAMQAAKTRNNNVLLSSRSSGASPTEQQLKLMKESAAKKAAYDAKIAAAKKAVQEAAAQKIAQEKAAKAAAEKAAQAKVVTAQKSSMLKSTQAPNIYTATTQQETEYTYSAYDTLGRKQTLTENQYNQLNKANSANTNNTRTYTVIPEEVSNSNAVWWINSNGAYEWIPVTASDKAHLADLNSRTGKHMTTLTTGGAPSDEYSNKWYSTGGGKAGVGERGVKKVAKDGSVTSYGSSTYVPEGSGSIKLAKMKASSSVNTSASAKTGTAQQKTVSVVTAGQQLEKQALADESKIRNALTKYESKEAYTVAVDTRIAKQKAAQKEYQKQLEAYTDVVGKAGVIDVIEGKGKNSTGEGNVRVIKKDKSGKIIASSKTASEYKKETSDVKLDRQVKAIEKSIQGMSKSKQIEFLTGIAANDLPVKGTASDLWTRLNTDITDGHVDKALAGKITSGGTTDVLDNIAKKQIAGKSLSAQEVVLLGKVSELYSPSTQINKFTDGINEVAEIVSNLSKKYLVGSTDKTANDYNFAGKYSGNVADFVNSMRGAIVETPEMLAAGVTGVVKAGEYTTQQIKAGNLKSATENTALVGTYYGSQMARGMAKQAYDDPVKFVASCALAEVVMGGAAKGVSKVAKPLTKATKSKIITPAYDAVKSTATVKKIAASTPVKAVKSTGSKVSKVGSALSKSANLLKTKSIAKGIKDTTKKQVSKATEVSKAKIKKVSSKPSDYTKTPAEYDITNIGKPVKTTPKTTAQKITGLKKRIDKLETAGKAADLAKAKELKRIVRAYETAAKNQTAKASLSTENYAGVKELANIKAFDKELASLREMKSFADDYMQPGKYLKENPIMSEVQAENALIRMTRSEKLEAGAIKEGTTQAARRTAKIQAAKKLHTKRNLEIRTEKAVNKVKKAVNKVSEKVKAKTTVKKPKVEFDEIEYRKGLGNDIENYNKKVATKSLDDIKFDEQLEVLKTKEFNTKALELEEIKAFDNELAFLREAKKFSNDYMSEGKYKISNTDKVMGQTQAERALMKLDPAEKATIRAINKGSDVTKLRKANVKANKAAHAKANRKIKIEKAKKSVTSSPIVKKAKKYWEMDLNEAVPSVQKRVTAKVKSVTRDVKTTVKTGKRPVSLEKTRKAAFNKLQKVRKAEHSSARKVLRGAKKSKQHNSTPQDITDISGYQKSKVLGGKLTYKDIAEYKAKNPSGIKVKPKQASAKIDEYTYYKDIKAEVKRINEEITKNKNKSQTDIDFDAYLEDLKVKDFDARMEFIKDKRNKGLMSEADADKAISYVTNDVILKEVTTRKAKAKAHTEDKFKAAVEKNKVRNAEIRKSFGDESAAKATTSGDLQLLQKVDQAVKTIDEIKKLEPKTKPKTSELVAGERTKLKRKSSVAEKRIIEKAKNAKIEDLERLKTETPVKPKSKLRYAAVSPVFPYAIRSASASDYDGYVRHPGEELSIKAFIGNLDKTKNIIDVQQTIKQSVRNKVSQGAKQTAKTVIKPFVTPIVKPVVKPIVKPVVKPIVEPAVIPDVRSFIDSITKVVEIQKSATSSTNMPRTQTAIYIARKKKKPVEKATETHTTKKKKSVRVIKNTLGSMKSMFG